MANAGTNWKAILFYVLGFLSLVFVILALRPYPTPNENNCFEIEGKLVDIEKGVSDDVVISIANDDHYYYINRGLEKGINLEDWHHLQGKMLHLTIIDHWTPLDPFNSMRKVVRVSAKNEILFSELTINN